MDYIENLLFSIGGQLQSWGGMQSLYALAAVLVVYIFIVFGRTENG